MGNAKAKGSGYEREIAKILSLWWTDNERDDIFWRAASSGARATQRGKLGKTLDGQYGDLCATDPSGKPLIDQFIIEIKKGYAKHTIGEWLDFDGKNGIVNWILKLQEQCGEPHTPDSWMLIHKRDRKKALIYVPITQRLKTFLLPEDPYSCRAIFQIGGQLISVRRFDDFLQQESPNSFR